MPKQRVLPSQVGDWATADCAGKQWSQVLGLLKGLYPQTFCTHPTLHANCSQILLAPRLTWPLYPCKTGTQEGRAATCLPGPSAHSYTLLRI